METLRNFYNTITINSLVGKLWACALNYSYHQLESVLYHQVGNYVHLLSLGDNCTEKMTEFKCNSVEVASI